LPESKAGMPLELREIKYGSPEYEESLKLRTDVLRKPLGLVFSKEDLAGDDKEFHLAVFQEGHLVGILLLKPLGKEIVKMRQVAIAENIQGKGLGSALVKFSEAFSMNKGFTKIELHARKTAVPFYRNLDYQVVGIEFLEVGIPLLENINDPEDLRALLKTQLPLVCDELRSFLIAEILANGGHFSANLGVVELTVALHYVLNTPEDKLIWDVGHQAYGHKVITGRRKQFDTIRKKGGLSGFLKMDESPYDAFGAGHSSTSISAALGMAISARLQKIHRRHVAVIGDGSLTAGQAFEALNHAGVSGTNLLVILNDNHIGIDPNMGALDAHLQDLLLGKGTNNIFEALGFRYFGPEDGHNVVRLAEILRELAVLDEPVLLHIKTVKGKGYAPAEKEQTLWHAAPQFVKVGEEQAVKKATPGSKYQDVFGETLLELARMDEKVVGITPAMPTGCSMNMMMAELPERVFDVGIAEQHAVTLAAGMAASGMIPFCNIYSSFLQRAYDQVIHDVCLQNLPVIFCLDRAGVVGEDGPTHHGLYDLAFLRCIPNISVWVPSNEIELRNMLYTAYKRNDGPVAIRYPRGKGQIKDWKQDFEEMEWGKGLLRNSGHEAAVLCIGTMVNEAMQAAKILEKDGIKLSVADMRFAKPLDNNLLEEIFAHHQFILTIEDGTRTGGFGSSILEWANENGWHRHVKVLGFPDSSIPHATREELFEDFGLDASGIVKEVKLLLG
jgi:1-deoxy-D-xylulose-5-phosphate synthase